MSTHETHEKIAGAIGADALAITVSSEFVSAAALLREENRELRNDKRVLLDENKLLLVENERLKSLRVMTVLADIFLASGAIGLGILGVTDRNVFLSESEFSWYPVLLTATITTAVIGLLFKISGLFFKR